MDERRLAEVARGERRLSVPANRVARRSDEEAPHACDDAADHATTDEEEISTYLTPSLRGKGCGPLRGRSDVAYRDNLHAVCGADRDLRSRRISRLCVSRSRECASGGHSEQGETRQWEQRREKVRITMGTIMR